jgi:stage II sporulation protein D
MPRLTVLLACLCLLPAGSGSAAPAPPAPAATPAPVFVVSGRGFGHGVGMSQYGALGLARNGADYASILAHYYPGTELGTASVGRVRVLLAENVATLNVGSAAGFRVRDGSGAIHELPAGALALAPGLRLNVGAGGLRQLAGPLVFTAGAAPLRLNGRRYRGSLEIAAAGGRLRAINAVALDAYLFGVVPREVPAGWPEEALKAQAVAARSYALAVRRSGPFDLYADVRSQVYGGLDAEQPATTAAVLATAGEVVLHEGRVATTFFFSTSGGRTANVADAWPGSAPVPYLVSVPDPHDAVSPHHTWGPVPVAPARLRAALGARSLLLDVRTTTNASGRVGRVVGVTAAGEVSAPAAGVRTRLGLRSTWFRIGLLRLDRPAQGAVTFGSRLRLTGLARDVPGARVEQRAHGRAWAPVSQLAPGEEGRFASLVRPVVTTEFRLAAGTVRTAAVRVPVAPLVRLAAPETPSALTGLARPVSLAGAAVAIQRLQGGAWTRVATARLDESGSFAASLELVPGRYRALLAPGRGFVAGASAPLDVVAP